MADDFTLPTVVPPGEAALVTTEGQDGLAFYFPKRAEQEGISGAAMFLLACYRRAETDEDFVREMLEWLEAPA